MSNNKNNLMELLQEAVAELYSGGLVSRQAEVYT